MGRSYVAMLILGWTVDQTKAKDYLWKYKVGSCGNPEEEEQCLCGEDCCWTNRSALPLQKELTITHSSPYYDCDPDDQEVYITVLDIEGVTVDNLKQRMDAIDWKAAEEIAVQLGATRGPAKIFSVPHVF